MNLRFTYPFARPSPTVSFSTSRANAKAMRSMMNGASPSSARNASIRSGELPEKRIRLTRSLKSNRLAMSNTWPLGRPRRPTNPRTDLVNVGIGRRREQLEDLRLVWSAARLDQSEHVAQVALPVQPACARTHEVNHPRRLPRGARSPRPRADGADPGSRTRTPSGRASARTPRRGGGLRRDCHRPSSRNARARSPSVVIFDCTRSKNRSVRVSSPSVVPRSHPCEDLRVGGT